MIQDIEPKKLDNAYRPAQPRECDRVLVFYGSHKREDRVLLRMERAAFPTVGELMQAGTLERPEGLIYLFAIEEIRYYLYPDCDRTEVCLEGYAYEVLRALRMTGDEELAFAGVTGYHLFQWYRDTRFCGRCGHPLQPDGRLRAMYCPECREQFFPRIAPAVIVGVRDQNRILVSRYAGREYKGIALLAGFCEIGETPEETVRREVLEEVGLQVKNVTYFASQPWGFDSNLLLGYYADVDGGAEIVLDEEELAAAEFVSREELEREDNLKSLTATMIETFRQGRDPALK